MEEKEREEFRLEKAFDEIEELLSQMGDKDVPLEESFRLYQKGMELLKRCNEKLDRVEKQMLEIDEEGHAHEFS